MHPRYRYVHMLDVRKVLGIESYEKLIPVSFRRLSLTAHDPGYAWSSIELAWRLGFCGHVCIPIHRMEVSEIKVKIKLRCKNKPSSVTQLLKNKASNTNVAPAPTADELCSRHTKATPFLLTGALNARIHGVETSESHLLERCLFRNVSDLLLKTSGGTWDILGL